MSDDERKDTDFDDEPARVRRELAAMEAIVEALAPLSPRMRAATITFVREKLADEEERSKDASSVEESKRGSS